ncbi:MAG TPA: hypothetical protein VNA14_03130 [Mycobacteriales bacterium]|nr:hypothetical protein [Mycobacteriales bacterium]
MAWRWTYDGGPGGTSGDFPGQADAEAWLGDHWQELLSDGVLAVTLTEDGRAVYGPMSLEPA